MKESQNHLYNNKAWVSNKWGGGQIKIRFIRANKNKHYKYIIPALKENISLKITKL